MNYEHLFNLQHMLEYWYWLPVVGTLGYIVGRALARLDYHQDDWE